MVVLFFCSSVSVDVFFMQIFFWLSDWSRRVTWGEMLLSDWLRGILTPYTTNGKVESLTFINFQKNYQTAEIYFYLYHVTPLNITVSNYCVN